MSNFGMILNCSVKCIVFKCLSKSVYSLLYSSNLFLLRCFQNIAYAYIFLKPLLNYSFSKFMLLYFIKLNVAIEMGIEFARFLVIQFLISYIK